MIKNLEVGEIVRINKEEWIIFKSRIGGSEKTRPDIKKLSPLLEKIYRKPYLNKMKGGL